MNLFSSSAASSIPMDIRMAAISFKRKRLDYYLNLADRIKAANGRRNLIDFFTSDAARHAGKPQGKLANYWASQIESTGGNLAASWEGTLPNEEVMLIRVAQNSGDGAVETTLRDLARVGKMIEDSKKTFIATSVVGVIAVLIAIGSLLMVPLFSVPSFKQSFSMIPLDNWSAPGQKLLSIASFVTHWGLPLLIAIVSTFTWIVWSLPRVTGPLRTWLDKWSIFHKLYRNFRGAIFMASLASMTKGRGSNTVLVRPAIEILSQNATKYMRWQMEKILANIDARGSITAESFDVGLFDEDILFFFMDVFEARGFDAGMEEAGRRSEIKSPASIALRAAILRWSLLAVALGTLLYIVFLHMSFVYSIRQMLMNSAGV